MIRHILVAVGAHRDDEVLKTAIDKARHTGARLTAVYVVDTMPWWAMAGVEYGCPDTPQMVEELERTVQRRCNETFELDAWDIHTRAMTVPLQGGVGRTIARLADELDADLVVVGAGHHPKWRFWEARMSDLIARCTRRSVLIATSAQTRQDRDARAGEAARRHAQARASAQLFWMQPRKRL
ncbi:universal stress protein [Paraburkholderia phymatum]|uniref:UspA domain protein n=1 Tax=Paraburkholderia phymatum (strain DSM 17167 / CIP 108236 / LMG 21445 / STM815) TaxID=391038 RepID=B2JPG1_PARP8|nr:universal stress protein [Paraburkholderia phymatum]ACC74618.1 UspA domain protein [Paraburkholderia phymatum STM815]